MTYALAYIGTVVAFLGLDFLWLGTVATGFYRSRIGSLLLDQPNFVAAGVFYLFYVAGIVYFAVQPALLSGNWTTAAVAGAILGFIAYGTYDMTNLATLKNWSPTVSAVDMAWGTALTSFSAVVGYFVAQKFSSGS
ncbi:DUF2177 family protein [Aliirhizobium smilacinae]|uniref:DUF2177 family protein n=1 Tax=Aliirhizobium smilacinae TaxID=1395944 RepID=A0A5C4XFW5_9HYPH|nr:DUF2177 family protein [Rhizobium smilacinae]TNM62317.1 DUF2177 family protein [Rhizobium smilacinae]